MKTLCFVIIFISTIFFWEELFCANLDSLATLNIPEVSIYQSRNTIFKDDKFITRFDSITLLKNQNANLGEMLMFTTPVTIQQYGGAGSLTTLSFRGTGSNHTQVNWNGFPINAIGTGEMDLSLVGSDIANQVSLVHGASGAMYGSGTFGGALELNNVPDWNNRLVVKFNSEVGAFDNNIEGNTFSSNPGQLDSKKYSFKINAGSGQMQYSLLGFTNNALNKYRYIDNNSFIPHQQSQNHNQFSSQGIVQTFNLKIGTSQQLEAGMWAQQKHYQVPEISSSNNNANQNDSTFKTFLKWNYLSGTSSYNVKTGFFYDYLHYTDSNIDQNTGKLTNSKIGSKRWYNDFNYRKYLGNNIVYDAGLTFLRTFSVNNNFNSLHIDETMFAIYSAIKYNVHHIVYDFSFRQEFVTGYNPWPQFSFGESWKINKIIVLKSNISNKYRVPAFNDKYWIDGAKGNPNLKPENGIGLDAGTEVNYVFSSIDNKLSATVYSNTINNWIQWVPDSYGIFYAQNYKQVWARGFEGAFDQSIKLEKNAINWCVKYNFTPSTNLKADNPQVLGKQLMYVPLHSATFNFNLKLHTANIGFDWAIRSQSNSQADGQGLPLQGYSIVNFDLNNTFFFLANSFRFDFKINNLFDKQYYTYLPTYPLPGRAFYISVTYIFNKPDY